MSWHPVFSAERKRPSNTVGPDYYQPWPRTNADVSQLAPAAPIRPRPRSQPPLDYHPSEALALKEAMQRDRQAAILRRDMQAVHQIESDLRDVTRAILRGN